MSKYVITFGMSIIEKGETDNLAKVMNRIASQYNTIGIKIRHVDGFTWTYIGDGKWTL
jgi:hypothetical protein